MENVTAIFLMKSKSLCNQDFQEETILLDQENLVTSLIENIL